MKPCPNMGLTSQRERDFFASGYLTLTSVIQATAFALFVYSAVALSKHSLVSELPYWVCNFCIIVTLTYGYFVGARDLVWPMDGLDILLPYVVGVAEGGMIVSLIKRNLHYWSLSQFILSLTSIAIFLNALIKGRREGREIGSIPRGENQASARGRSNQTDITQYAPFLVVMELVTLGAYLYSYHVAAAFPLWIIALIIAAIWASIFIALCFRGVFPQALDGRQQIEATECGEQSPQYSLEGDRTRPPGNTEA